MPTHDPNTIAAVVAIATDPKVAAAFTATTIAAIGTALHAANQKD